MQIVVLLPGGISDQLLFFPTLDDLKQTYPNAEIDVIVEPRAKGAYRVCKSVNDVFAFDFQDRNSPADWANLLGVMRDRSYEAVFSTQSGWGIGLLLWLTGIPNRISYGNGSNSLFFNKSVPFNLDQPITHRYHDLLQGLDINTPCPDLAISIPKREMEWAEAEQKRLGISGSGYVLIHGGTGDRSETSSSGTRYPAAKWQQIIQDFQTRQPELPLILAQDPSDREFISTLVQSCPTLKVTNPKDIGQLAAMIAGANLLLCTDDFPLHLAVALKVYTLALFGATEPATVMPTNDKFQSIQSTSRKIADIEPTAVLAKVWGG
jgi:ADP-heptose:LPS heptosyltransferase